jgi:hypothetical protein
MLEAAIESLLAGNLNSIGLVLGFVGVLHVFFCGLPPMEILNDGAYIETMVTPKMKIFIRLSRLGLALIGAGFVSQFLAVSPR